MSYDDMSLKELRKAVGFTRDDVEDELGIPVRTLENWENGYRNCPDYVEDILRDFLKKQRLVALIRYEKSFGEDNLEGYSCYFRNVENNEFDKFSWFYPIVDGKVSDAMMDSIRELAVCGFEINYL